MTDTSPSQVSHSSASPVASRSSPGLTGWRAWLMILAITGSTLLNVYSNGAMTVAIPSIGEDLNFTQPDLAWPLQAYNLASGCLLLLTGRLADKFGRRVVFLLGALWFSIFSVPPIFAPNPASFNTFMGLLGLGAAAMTSAGIGVLGGNLEGALKNRAFSVLSAGQGVGFILGLLSSGFLCQLHRGWRYIFVLQACLGVLFSLFAFISIPKDSVKFDGDMDWPGLALSLSGLTLLVFALSQSQNVGWRVPYVPALFAISVIILVMFIYWERHAELQGKSVLVPLTIFKGYRFAAFFSMIFLVWWSFNVLQYFVTLYYQDVQKLRPSQTGIKFIPEAISGVLINTICGFLIEFVPAEWLNALGIGASAASAAIFAVINPRVSYWRNAFLVMILMPAADTAFIVGNLFTVNALDEKSQALAGALFSTATRISTAMGLAITSAVATAVTSKTGDARGQNTPDSLLQGYHAAGWLCFACAASGIFLNSVAFRGMGVLSGRKAVQSSDVKEDNNRSLERDPEKR